MFIWSWAGSVNWDDSFNTLIAIQTILKNYKMPILSIICCIVRNVSAKYQNILILCGFEFEVNFCYIPLISDNPIAGQLEYLKKC